MKTYIQSISLQGFRAYLAEQTFELGPGVSLAIYAPNAKGKSSLVDAIEFFFSPHGSLRRLGERRSGTQAGPDALEHVQAEEKKITPRVILQFRRGKDPLGDERKVSRPPSPVPSSGQTVLALRKHDFIIHGHELRQFVENQTPEERYREVSQWFGLTPLLNIQKNLRAIRRRVKELAESDRIVTLRVEDLKRATKNAVTRWSEAAVVSWVNDFILAPLDRTLTITKLDKSDLGYLEVTKRTASEADSLGLTALSELETAAKAIIERSEKEEKGSLIEFEAACTRQKAAAEVQATEKAKAKDAAFHEIWTQAQKVFSDENIPIANCPVCDTALERTAKRSRQNIVTHIHANLEILKGYDTAIATLNDANSTLRNTYTKLKSDRDALLGLLRAGKLKSEEDSLKPYFKAVDSWKYGDPAPDSISARNVLLGIAKDASEKAAAISAKQGTNTYAGALAKIDDLIRIKSEVELAVREKAELANLHQKLDVSALQIDKDIAAHVGSLLDELKTEINDLYKKIQGPGAKAPSIRIEPPDPENRGQLQLNLVVDFSDNRKGVIPSGYLSDSQVHTLALSLRLAALKLFNKELPVAILDDVVTSYDADHRKVIASVLAVMFPGFQFIVVTHDERFFSYLKEHLPHWRFRQITHIEDGFGPKYVDHRIADEVIEAKLKNGERASNEIRQAEDEWLLAKAREFGVDVRIRDIDKPYAYERSELAASIATFLKSKKIHTPVIEGFSNSFWNSLQKGTVENFGSHFQDNPTASWSGGDEKTRWQEFKTFRDLFVCSNCGHRKFKRPRVGVDRPLCDKCETPFSFSGTARVVASDYRPSARSEDDSPKSMQ